MLRMSTGTFGRAARVHAPGDPLAPSVQTAGENAAAHTQPMPTAPHNPAAIAARARGCIGGAALAGGSARCMPSRAEAAGPKGRGKFAERG